jgi:hypothetical protein
MIIEYIIEFQKKEKIFFTVDTQRNKNQEVQSINRSSWTELNYCKCEICLLKQSEINYCPAALDIHDVLLLFDKVNSYDFVTVNVRTPLRTYYKECDSQTALGSLIGAIMASSACPTLSKLKYMAEYHMPFANLEETLIRTIGFYLIKQYLINNKGGSPDFELKGLTKLYSDLQNVNYFLKKRLNHAFSADASVNAIAQYFSLSALIQKSLEEQISDIKHIFD